MVETIGTVLSTGVTMSECYCAAPFNSVRVDATDNNQSWYRPCCMYQGKQTYNNILEYIDSVELQELKQQFLTQTHLPAGCQACEHQEQQQQVSWRHHFNNKFADQRQITQLEVFPGNVCNLRCFMCSENYSTALGAERTKLNLIENYREIDNIDACIDSIRNLPDLTDVSFIGGEFFLTKKNLEILDLVIEKQLGVRVVTNGTVLLPEHMTRLQQISRLELQISLDGIQDSYEFMRYPAVWTEVEKNIERIRTTLKHAQINFNFVVQPLNVQYMIPTVDYANRLMIPIRLTNLVDPAWLTWKILTSQEKTTLIDLLDQQMSQYKLTTRQQKTIKDYQQTIHTVTTVLSDRQIFQQKMSGILKYRNISPEKVQQHLGQIPGLLV